MKLILFDIDGTLTNTIKVDDHCFCQTFNDLHQVTLYDVDWSIYKNVTDLGLMMDIFYKHKNRMPLASEVQDFKNHFLQLLQASFLETPSLFNAIPGAPTLFQKIKKKKTYHIGLATGGWKHTALFKLKAANIDHQSIPLASSDHKISRENILQEAIDKAHKYYNCSHYDQITYVGDGVWDKYTTDQLGIHFIGLDQANNGKLKRLGVSQILSDFNNTALFEDYLEAYS